MDQEWITLDERMTLHVLDPAPIPTLLVEGKDDVEFVLRLIKHSEQLMNTEYLVVVTESKSVYFARRDELEFAHCVLLDRNHDVALDDSENVVYTHFYSVESYLVREPVVEAAVRRLARPGDLRHFNYTAMFAALVAAIRPVARVCWLKVKCRGPWEDVPCEGLSIWQVVDQSTLLPNCVREEHWWTGVLSRVGLTMDDPELKSLCDQAEKALAKFDDQAMLRLVPGKHLFDVMYEYFRRYMQSCMTGGKSKRAFYVDLCGHLMEDKFARDLLARLVGRLLPQNTFGC